jgi:hypothetical protein
MTCPHCLIDFHDEWSNPANFAQDRDQLWFFTHVKCPACNRVIVKLINRSKGNAELRSMVVYPRATSRTPLPASVPEPFASDYREACLVLADSAKASAALSRRCLQHLLRELGGFKAKTLDSEIQQAIDSKTLPPYITESLDAVRAVGNFAAHPIKSTSSGEIIEVEPGEAEQQLDTLELLFDFYFEAPARAKAKRDALNAKLQEAGKPLLK